MTVKGTKLRPLKIVEHSPVFTFFRRLFMLAIVVAAVAGSFYYGYFEGMAGQKTAYADIQSLSRELSEKTAKIAELEQQVANLNMGSVVDRQASEDVRKEVIALKEELAKLEEDNSFYRNLMAPTGNKRGLTFGNVELVDTDSPRVYSYKVVMQQLATNHTPLKGTLSFTVVGRKEGQTVKYTLAQLSDKVTTNTLSLRFKYFQTIEGKLTLPEGFDPEAIELVARSVGTDPVTVEKRFGWLVEES